MDQHPLADTPQLRAHLLELDEVPLIGRGKEFPWNAVCEALRQRFELSDLTLEHSPPAWREAHDYEMWLGTSPACFSFSAPPLEGGVTWVMSEPDARLLMQHLLGGNEATAVADHAMQEAFCQFLALEVIQLARHADFPPDASLQLHPHVEALSGDVLAIDVSIGLAGQTIAGTVLLSAEFCRSWRFYSASTAYSERSQKLQDELMLPLHMKLGEASLTHEEWKQVVPGSFICLDRCSVDPDTREGDVDLVIEERPLFKGTLVPEGVEISRVPQHYEEG